MLALLSVLLVAGSQATAQQQFPDFPPQPPAPQFGRIVAVEQRGDGFFVSTGDNSFALASNRLRPMNLSAVSITDDQVALLSALDTDIRLANLAELSAEFRDFVAVLKDSFLSNLDGLDVEAEEPSEEHLGPAQNPSARSFVHQEHESSSYSYEEHQAAAPTLNYHNLNSSPLARTLAGDIYQLDAANNVLLVYSASVSVGSQSGASTIYRDDDYFVYSDSELPQSINTLFNVGDHVVLVYGDGSVLAKWSGMLNSAELEVVASIKSQLRRQAERQASVTRASTESSAARSLTNELEHDLGDLLRHMRDRNLTMSAA